MRRRGGIVIGVTTTIEEIRESRIIASGLRLLKQAVSRFADSFIRARATIGGTFAMPPLAADTPLALLIYGAEVEAVSAEEYPSAASSQGGKRTPLQPGELVRALRIPGASGETEGKVHQVQTEATKTS